MNRKLLLPVRVSLRILIIELRLARMAAELALDVTRAMAERAPGVGGGGDGGPQPAPPPAGAAAARHAAGAGPGRAGPGRAPALGDAAHPGRAPARTGRR